jgi:hypothetical protein
MGKRNTKTNSRRMPRITTTMLCTSARKIGLPRAPPSHNAAPAVRKVVRLTSDSFNSSGAFFVTPAAVIAQDLRDYGIPAAAQNRYTTLKFLWIKVWANNGTTNFGSSQITLNENQVTPTAGASGPVSSFNDRCDGGVDWASLGASASLPLSMRNFDIANLSAVWSVFTSASGDSTVVVDVYTELQ